MALYSIENLSFSYPGQANVLQNITLSVSQGEFVLVTGRSGCGKTTLLRHFRTELRPVGNTMGTVCRNGCPLYEMDRRLQTSCVGFVQQDPDTQIVTDKVWHEMAFGLESLGYENGFIRRRVAEMSAFFGITEWFHRDITHLSGGQKQLLNLAAVMTFSPELLVLDEPTAMLDPVAAKEFLEYIGRINRELGTTIIMTEHRMEDVLPLCTRVIAMEQGGILLDEAPETAMSAMWKQNANLGSMLPSFVKACAALNSGDSVPINIPRAKSWLGEYARQNSADASLYRKAEKAVGEVVADMQNVWFRYDRNEEDILRGISLQGHRGEILALMGGNGVGKSTALGVWCGMYKPWRGKVRLNARGAMLPQRPQMLFSTDSVRDELREVSACEDEITQIVQRCSLQGLMDRHPMDISGGEMQKVALAKVLLTKPEILFLDEPTKGVDAAGKEEMACMLQSLAADGMAVVMVSHDVEFCAMHADRIVLMFDGKVAADQPPRAFFSGNSFYTTSANRMARDILPDAITAEDVALAFGKDIAVPHTSAVPPENKQGNGENNIQIKRDKQERKKPMSLRAKLGVFACMLSIPLTVLTGVYWLQDKQFALVSVLVLLEALLAFAVAFEGRKPQAREIALLSALCAIGVAGRAAFFMLPSFKPVLAVVTVAGAALGMQHGFTVGAMTMFASNFFFGHGPWTPWQMFAAGAVGMLAGFLFYNRQGNCRLHLCVYGTAAALLLYGVIVNAASVFMYQPQVTIGALAASVIAGLPVDITHAVATGTFLWLFGMPFLRKIERARQKLQYGSIA